MTKHTLSFADETFIGSGAVPAMEARYGKRGVRVSFLTRVALGAPIAADTNALIAAATGAELPNNASKTYTVASAGTSPMDDAGLPTATTIQVGGVAVPVLPLDVPRNITLAATHDTSLVAMTVTLSGYDDWGYAMKETLSITATGTSKTAAGKKAFKYLTAIAIASAGNATTNTLSVGFGNVFGLPVKLTEKVDLIQHFFGDAADAGTVVAADATTPSATTGDVRGTYAPAGTPDGSSTLVLFLHVQDKNSANGLKGLDQYAG
jgi:hypothetical protein